MIGDKSIKNCLKGYIKKGIETFVIYPFGVNGVNVRNILKDYFDISPILIVDNEYSKYNSCISDFQTLRQNYKEDMYVILTIEDDKVNGIIKNELLQFVPLLHIINLNDLKRKEAELSNFYVKSFMPEAIYSSSVKHEIRNLPPKSNNQKIKVRFVNHGGSTWNAIKTICMAFLADKCFDILILTGSYVGENVQQQINQLGFKSVYWEDYCIQEDSPDVLVLNHPYDTVTQIDHCREYCKLIFVASMQLIRYSYDMRTFWNIQNRGFGRFNPDYFLFDSLLYHEIMQSEYASEKIVEMGNAKFDGIYEACKEKHYEEGWEKLKGKRVVLWTTDHGIYDSKVSYGLTFDLYAKTIFQYAMNNSDMGIIFRPHSTFINEMLKNNFWSQNDLEMLKKYCYESPNIVFDDSVTYDNAYSIADGIIADAFCGISCSALPTLKPICLTYRSIVDLPYHEELANCYDSAYSRDDVISFMNKVKNNQDSTLELRKEACKKYIKNFDGKNGWRIKEFIKEKYFELIK